MLVHNVTFALVLLGAAVASAAATSQEAVSTGGVRRLPLALVARTPNPASKATTTVSSGATIGARNNVLSVARTLAEESPTGVFIVDPKGKADLKEAISELEAVAGTPTDRERQLLVGDWTLVCTTNAPTRPLGGGGKGSNKKRTNALKIPSPFGGLPSPNVLQDQVRKSVVVTQRIRTEGGTDGTIDRVDNVVEYTPLNLKNIIGKDSPFKALRDLNANPLEVSSSKVTLVHKAEVESVSPVMRTKIGLKSIVLNVAGTSQYLEPEGADVLGLNVPLGDFLNGGNFDTTFVDENMRISRGTIGFLDELRVFVRKGFDIDDVLEERYEDSVATAEEGDGGTVSPIEERLEKVADAVSGVQSAMETAADDVRGVVESDIKSVNEAVEGAVTDLRTAVEGDLKEIGKSLDGVRDAIVGEEVGASLGKVRDSGLDLVTDMQSVVEEDMKEIGSAIDGAREAVTGEDKAASDENASADEPDADDDKEKK